MKRSGYKEYFSNEKSLPKSTKYDSRISYIESNSDSSANDMEEFNILLSTQKADLSNDVIESESNSSYDHLTVQDDERNTNNFESNNSVTSESVNSFYFNDFEYRNTEEEYFQNNDFLTSPTNLLASDEEYFEEEKEEDKLSDMNKTFDGLNDLLNRDDANSIINAKFVVSKCEILLAIMKFVTHYSLPNSATEDLCKMINTFLNDSILPDSRYLINKLFCANNSVQYHAVCEKCNLYLRKFERKEKYVYCETCEDNIPVTGNNCNFFVTLNIRDEVKNLLKANHTYYDAIVSNEQRESEEKEDIFSGSEYTNFVNSLPDEQRKCYATCVFNSDGSPTFKSASYSIWPIQISINELPMDIRSTSPITWALWFGKNKPNMNIFMKAFVEDLAQINNEGINCSIQNESRNIKLYPICCCVDSVARAPMQGIIQFNGYYGCSWCLHPGIPIQHKKKRTIKYPLLNYVPQERTEITMVQYLRDVLATGRSVFGIKRPSVLMNLDYFNIISGFVPDVMHCVYLGICKQFAYYWFNTTRKSYSIADNINDINDIIISVQVPQHISRLSRSLKQRKYWKAREWENWLLFYSVPILNEVPGFEQFLEHWQLLVEALHILTNQYISLENINKAEKYLKEFVCLTEKYYSPRAMTYNIHQLLHLCQSVIDWGPLWAHSGYSFESGNGKILGMVKAAKGVLHQVCRAIDFKQGTLILEDHVKQTNESPVIDFCQHLDKNVTGKSVKISECRYFGSSLSTNQHWVTSLSLSQNETKSFHRMVKQNCLFTSCKRKVQRSNNSFALTSDGKYVQIVEFIADEHTNREFTVCKIIMVENGFTICTAIKRIINISEELSTIETRTIKSIAVYLKIKEKEYIIAVPNMFHY